MEPKLLVKPIADFNAYCNHMKQCPHLQRTIQSSHKDELLVSHSDPDDGGRDLSFALLLVTHKIAYQTIELGRSNP